MGNIPRDPMTDTLKPLQSVRLWSRQNKCKSRQRKDYKTDLRSESTGIIFSTSELRRLIIFLPGIKFTQEKLPRDEGDNESQRVTVHQRQLCSPENNHERTGDDKRFVPTSNKSSHVQPGLNTLTAKQSRLNRQLKGKYTERVYHFLWSYASIYFKRKCVYGMLSNHM